MPTHGPDETTFDRDGKCVALNQWDEVLVWTGRFHWVSVRNPPIAVALCFKGRVALVRGV